MVFFDVTCGLNNDRNGIIQAPISILAKKLEGTQVEANGYLIIVKDEAGSSPRLF